MLNIKCVLKVPGQEPRECIITDAVENVIGNPLEPFLVIIEGESYPITWVFVNDSPLNDIGWITLYEWFKGYKHYRKTSRTEYFFEENGMEYWYETEDFRKHYTCQEG